MKKLILSSLLVATALIVNAQNKDTTSTSSGRNGNNEIKLNLASTLAGVPEFNYERILKDDMSVGLAVMVGLENDSDISFGIIPNYRIYFGNKKANGFFIEGSAAVISNRVEFYNINYTYSSSSVVASYRSPSVYEIQTNFGLGAAAGAKFITKNGFVGEIYLGAGRLFGETDIDVYPRAGITIGKRF